MPYRKVLLAENEVYHVYSRSIAEFKIFRSEVDYWRMFCAIYYYSYAERSQSLAKLTRKNKAECFNVSVNNKTVNIIAYCVMPTHFHLILQQLHDDSISQYINSLLKSYSEYFNIKYKRRGPLWEGRFQAKHIKTDGLLYHMTRYVHLNPVTAYIINDPKEWGYSSYKEYLNHDGYKICNFGNFFTIKPSKYKEFVCSRIDYQRELAKIKHLIIE